MTLSKDVWYTDPRNGIRAVRDVVHELGSKQAVSRKARLGAPSKTRKSAETRDRIMSAASELMVERGSTNFQMSEVSDRCNMSKGSLYYYFSDRDELVSAVFNDAVEELVRDFEELAARSGTAHEALKSLYAEFTRHLREGSPLALALTHELADSSDSTAHAVTSRFSRAVTVIAEQFERAKAEGMVREDIDGATAAVFTVGGLISSCAIVVSRGADDDPDAITAGIMDIILRGIGTDAWFA